MVRATLRKIAGVFVMVVAVLFSPLWSSAAQAQPLTDQALSQMLTDMGCEPKPLSHGYLVMMASDGWKTYVQLVISSDGSKLGMNANLGVVDESAVTADQWKALLAANEDIDPSAFYYDAEHKKLYMHRSLDNVAITPPMLRAQLDNFAGNIKSTLKLWEFTK